LLTIPIVASPIAAFGISAHLPIERKPIERPEPPAQGASNAALVNAVRTQLEPGEAKNALSSAWKKVFGEEPSAETSAILTAQWAHETARGSSMYNFNFGGIKGAGPGGFSVLQRTREGYGATEREIHDRFRAYGSAEEGAVDYVQLLNKRFPKALDAARDGDPEGFVRALKARGYFTGDESAYVRSVTSLSREMLGTEFAPVRRVDPESVLAAADFRAMSPAAGVPVSSASAPSATPFVDAMSIADALARSALRMVPAGDERREG
jgi:flagellar protein FlgJ